MTQDREAYAQDLERRLRAYDGFEGGHSDDAGADAYELISEAADALAALRVDGGTLTSEQVRKIALDNDHLAVPIRPGVLLTWTDEETGEVHARATLKGRNVIPLRSGEDHAPSVSSPSKGGRDGL